MLRNLVAISVVQVCAFVKFNILLHCQGGARGICGPRQLERSQLLKRYGYPQPGASHMEGSNAYRLGHKCMEVQSFQS